MINIVLPKFVKRTLLSPLYFLIVLGLVGCASKVSRFGVIFTNDFADIYRIPNNTKTKVEQLTFTPSIEEFPFLVTKKGEKIVFEVGLTGVIEEPSDSKIVERQQHVYILDTSSKKIVDITNKLVEYAMVPHGFSMDWSPDQKQFVMISNEGGGFEFESFLEFVDLDGNNRKKILIPTISKIPSLIKSVKWSPDGKKFLLTQGVIGLEQQLQYPGDAILIYDLKSGNIKQITDYQDRCSPREWSPTSRQIVVTCSFYIPFVDGVSGPKTVRILDVENPGQPYEHNTFRPCYDPSWSPDGKQIAFICVKETDQIGLFIINSDGNGIHEIKPEKLGNPVVLFNPIWSPDGTQIIYVAGTDYGQTNIYSVNSDGFNNHPLTNQEGFYNLISVYPLQ